MPGLNANYAYNKNFDQAKLTAGVAKLLTAQPLAKGHTETSPINLIRVVNKLATDARVGDIRWMAYMLATITAESRELVQVQRVDSQGKPMVNPKTKLPMSTSQWQMYEPANEMGHGKGLPYYETVKVNVLADGSVEITEGDGDRFKLGSNGQLIVGNGFLPYRKKDKSKNVGSPSGAVASKTYQDAAGTPISFYGRGMVQLTWWNGYADTSRAMGWGFDLLIDPTKMLNFDTSYEVMVVGMTTGIGYANSNKLSHYLNDGETRYVGARAIINGSERALMFSGIAESFEEMLMNARTP
jgi:hypothetical protein